MSTTSDCSYEVGRRYLHSTSGLPLSLRYIGPLEGTASTWLGVEWDDPERGKHSGVYQGQQIFTTRAPGAGSFIKFSPASSSSASLLSPGPAFTDVINERYTRNLRYTADGKPETVVLGSSNGGIIVEAPRLDKVRKKLTQLENLKEAALEGLWIGAAGETPLNGQLTALTRLNISQHLLSSWVEVERICAFLPALRALVMNESRLEAEVRSKPHSALERVTDLHLGKTYTSWDEVRQISQLMPNLRVLHLNDCQHLGAFPSTQEALSHLNELNLESSVLGDWHAIATNLSSLPSLQALDLSRVDFGQLTVSPISAAFPALTDLTLYKSTITTWQEIDALEAWTGKRLTSLRISLASPSIGSKFMKGDLSDRPILVAKLSQLKSLNSSVVTPAERLDSERFYVSYVSKILREDPSQQASDWGRYRELCQTHGEPLSSKPTTAKKNVLASRMITLHLHAHGRLTTTVQVLPSSPLRIAKRKIAKSLDLPLASSLKCCTVQNAEDVEAGEEAIPGVLIEEDGKEIGWWLQDGDWVHVEI